MSKSQDGARSAAPLFSLALLALAQIGTSADNGAFSIAAKEMIGVFGCSLAEVQLASTVYSLVAGTFMLVSGMLGILAGWTRTMRAGLLLAALGEAICAVSPNITLLIWGGRLLVGFGASLIIPSVLGMVPMLFEGARRKQAYGVIASSAAFATIVPVPLGILIDSMGFRVTFGAIAVYFLLLLIAAKALPREREFGHMSFDLPGAAVASLGLFMVMCGLSRVSVWGVVEPLPAAPFTVAGISPALPIVGTGLLLLIALVPLERWTEQKHGTALLPSSFVRNPVVRSGCVAIALPFFYMGAQGLIVTSFYQLVVGLDATGTALLGIASGLPMLVLAMHIPRKFPHANHWAVVRAGYVCLAVASACMALGVRDTSVNAMMLISTVVGGTGVGLVNSQANYIVASAVPPRDSQQSGGVQGAARNLGLALGAAAVGSVLLIAVNDGMDARIANMQALSPRQKAELTQRVHTYEGNETFVAAVSGAGISGPVVADLLSAHAQVRANAGSIASGVLVGASLLALATTAPAPVVDDLPGTADDRRAHRGGASVR